MLPLTVHAASDVLQDASELFVDHQVNSRSEISLREPPIPSRLYQRSECKLARNSNSGEGGGGYLMIDQARDQG
jgi:hypothetical protein